MLETTNSQCFCEAINIFSVFVLILLFRLPMPVALKMAVVCFSVLAFCTAEDEEGEKLAPELLGRSS